MLLLLFSRSVMSDSSWPHGLQHTRFLCPLPSPRVCSNSCPLSLWCHPTISSSVIHFSSCSLSFSATGSFQMSWLFASGGQSIGASALVILMKIQGCFTHLACGILVPQTRAPAVEVLSLNHWPTREVPHTWFWIREFICYLHWV